MFTLSQTTFCPLPNDPGSYYVHACVHVYRMHVGLCLCTCVHAMLRDEKPCMHTYAYTHIHGSF